VRRAVRWTVRWTLTAAVTLFFFRALRVTAADVRTLDASDWVPRPLPLVLSLAGLVGGQLYLVRLWVLLARRMGAPRLAFAQAVRVFFLAGLGRYVPGKVWPVAGLAFLAAREGVPPGPATAAAVLGYAISVLAALAVGTLYVWWGPPVGGPWTRVAAAGVLATCALLAAPAVLRRLVHALVRLARGTPETTQPRVAREGLRWLAGYAAAWLAFAAAFLLFWTAFRPLPAGAGGWLAAAAAFPAAYALGVVAVFAPAGLGVREGALVALTAPFLGRTDAVGLAVLARAWMTAAELGPLLWVAAVWRRQKGERRPDPPTR
jgi:hypothetical protein